MVKKLIIALQNLDSCHIVQPNMSKDLEKLLREEN